MSRQQLALLRTLASNASASFSAPAAASRRRSVMKTSNICECRKCCRGGGAGGQAGRQQTNPGRQTLPPCMPTVSSSRQAYKASGQPRRSFQHSKYPRPGARAPARPPARLPAGAQQGLCPPAGTRAPPRSCGRPQTWPGQRRSRALCRRRAPSMCALGTRQPASIPPNPVKQS